MDKHADVKHLLRVKLMELVGDDVGLGLILMVLPFLYFWRKWYIDIMTAFWVVFWPTQAMEKLVLIS